MPPIARTTVRRTFGLALVVVLALAAVASAATTRTSETPAQLRAGKASYEKAITAGFVKATKQLDTLLRAHPKKPTVVLDIDETTMSNWSCLDAANFDVSGLGICVVTGKSVAFPAAKTFIKHARARKVKIAFITGTPEVLCPTRKKNLIAQGIAEPFTLTCQPTGTTATSVVPYKSGARKALITSGATILLNIGDQKSDLAGGAAKKTVLLPDPIYRIG